MNKKIKRIIAKMLVVTLVAGIGLVNGTTMQVNAAEVASAEVATSVSDLSADKAAIVDISDVSFQMTDIRDSSKVTTFNGGDGKQAIIVFGGARCGNTSSALRYLNDIVENTDMSKLNVYVFEITSADNQTVIANMGSASNHIMLDSYNSNKDYSTLYFRCYRATVNGDFTMPLILYKGTDGVIYNYTSGSTTLTEIAKNIEAGGLDVNIDISLIGLNVTGETLYDEAYEVLKIMNQEREAAGVSPLVMDEELLEAAMQRAAECAVYYSHIRPDGSDCFTASFKIYGENIALGYRNAEAVMDGWMNSAGHKANILNESYQSVGVGCIYTNGGYTWTQCFGIKTAAEVSQPTNQNITYAIKANVQNVTPELTETSGTLTVGKTKELVIKTNQLSGFVTYINADSYNWSSNSDVATVDSNGVVTACKSGTAVITGRNKTCPTNTLTYTVTVPEYNPFGDVDENTWMYPYAKFAYDNGLITGKGNTADGKVKFDPNTPMTRAEFVQVLYSKEGKPTIAYKATFTDVKDSDWFDSAVIWASDNGIVAGNGSTFDPYGQITRQQMAAILYKYAAFKKYDTSGRKELTGFEDVNKVSSWALGSMQWALNEGVMTGAGTKLNPLEPATRAQAATMLKSFIDRYEAVVSE